MTALPKDVPMAAPARADVATAGIATAGAEASVLDLRFRALVGEDGWARLPEAVRRRFSRRLAPGDVAFYVGEVLETRLSRAGRVLSFLTRAIGAPLPLDDATGGGATVAVMENEGLGGQSWTRTYARAGRFPQVIHSAKCFSGPTGLEEHVGGGVGVSLLVGEESGAMVFRSVGYFFSAGRFRVRLPRSLAPGDMEIVHADEGGGAFLFKLMLRHPWLGVLVQQTARFRDA